MAAKRRSIDFFRILLGKNPTAVAYLMGMTLRSAERRQRSWIKAGGLLRIRAKIERYDMRSMKRIPQPPLDPDRL